MKNFLLVSIVLFLAGSASIAQLPDYLPTTGLVGWYPFNGNADDESGNGNNGTVSGATLTDDRFADVNSAYNFSANSIQITPSGAFDLTTFTVSGWIKTTSTGTAYETMFSHWIETPAGSYDYYGYWVGVYGNKATLYLADGAGGEANIQSSANVNDGAWHFIVGIYDGTAGYLYLDGNLESSSAFSMVLSSTTTEIGNDYDSEAFTGDLDDIGVWDVVLDQCAIDQLYAAQLLHTGVDVQAVCDSLTWIDGNTYTDSDSTVTFTLVGGAYNGCDSTVTLNLTINTVDVGTTLSDYTITSAAVGVAYQWLNCDSSYSVITGATNADYTATANGNYAVEVVSGGCTDTSDCVTISGLGLNENSLGQTFSIYPNPTKGKAMLSFENEQNSVIINLLSATGELIQSNTISDADRFEIAITGPAGVYFVEVLDEVKGKSTLRVIKE